MLCCPYACHEQRNQSSLHHAATGDLVTSIGLTCKEFSFVSTTVKIFTVISHQILKFVPIWFSEFSTSLKIFRFAY